jgi:hypothetical protein
MVRFSANAQSLNGLAIWLAYVVLLPPGWAASLLLFGPLVLFPLLLDRWEHVAPSLRQLCTLIILPVLASYACEQGGLAAGLALPWLLFALALLFHRLTHQLATRAWGDLVVKAYLVIGAAWLVLARLGQRPLDFEAVIVHATAMHFHYAGFVLPVLASILLEARPNRRRTVLRWAMLAGMPLVATGITLAQFGVHWPETLAACGFASVCVWFAGEQFWVGIETRRPLLLIASVFLTAAMGMAALYAMRHYYRIDAISIDFMIRLHGPIQVFGFALPAVLAWHLGERPPCAETKTRQPSDALCPVGGKR